VTDRAVREFGVYTEGRLALIVSDEPGTLRSMAAPPPGAGPPLPEHPFVDAQAYDAVSEDRLRRLLLESSSFDDYVRRLVGAGFDIASCRPLEGYDYELPGGVRLASGGELAGVCWPAPGQFTTLERQPAEDELGFEVATVTAYRPECGPPMLEALEAAGSFEDLLERLAAAGLTR
jgi:hypothetical protein